MASIFFVISGYLITTILLDELGRGDFSIARFYERRARRILPALFLVVAACLPFAWAWMMPAQLVNFGQSTVSVALFVSNVRFWLEEGYFAPSAELKPLLHTWSLAVEEQFYLLFPLFLAAVWRLGRRGVFMAVLALGAASLVLSLVLGRIAPSANFYLAPPRAWELMAGAACAFLPAGLPRRGAEAASLAGLAMIAASMLAYDHDTPFPGLAAVPPVAGTALVILFATPGTLAARLLSAGPMRGIGLISYSAYLWHQPLFAFTRLRSLGEPPPLLMGGLVVLTLVLAWITWRWVERPFRRGARVFATRRGVHGAAAAGGVAMVLVGAVVGPLCAGFPGRFPTAALLYAEAAGAGAAGPCHFDENRPLDRHPQPQCRHPDAAGNVSVLLLGDSQANALEHAVGEGLRRAETGYYAVSFGGCIPLPGFRRMRDSPSPDTCHEFDEAALDYAAATGIRTVILAGRFPLYLYGKRFDNGAGWVEKGDNGAVDVIAPDAPRAGRRKDRVLAAIETQIREIARRFEVVLVYPLPEAGWDVPSLAFRRLVFANDRSALDTPYAGYLGRTAEINALFDRIAADTPRVHPARIQHALCDASAGTCLNADSGAAYYSDDDHPSPAGAALVAPIILDAVAAAEGRVD